MSLAKAGYIDRVIDAKVIEYLKLFGAILIEGPKWCGKTWTSLNHANSVVFIMDPVGNYNNRTLARLNPALILPGDAPRLIDEWQEVPGIWDAVRFDVDQNPGFGKYILTGSVTPPEASYMHSGTGRIATLRMRPMSLFESQDSSGTISLGAIFNSERYEPFISEVDILRLIDLTIRGGWPETLKLPINKAGSVALEYINAIVKNEVPHEGNTKKDRAKLHKLLRSLARNNSTTATIKTLSTDTNGVLRQDQKEEDIVASRYVVADYIKHLKEIFVIDDIPPWNPEIRSKTIMRQAPKRIFTDPSLALAALGADRDRMLKDLNTFGFMFENLCLRDLSVYAAHYGGSVFHYRDNSDLEADAIIELPDGTWGAFEVKLGEEHVESAADTLLRLRDKMNAAGAEPPACLVIITGGGLAQVRDDGIYIAPINALRY